MLGSKSDSMYRFMENEESNSVQSNGAVKAPGERTLISMENIWKTYQMGVEQLHALRDVSFQVEKGEYLAIIGPSGSGKSTLMNLIGCLDSPSKGDYWINGNLVSEMTDDELARIRNKEI
ncbi:MAG TPA: ATP-binding cassette domain-containing protein, partial [Pyrinomonadaceae bacterium]|nr:ATP-binding cassette domain-containing protein [Pyrinomonadaceae bacterium]